MLKLQNLKLLLRKRGKEKVMRKKHQKEEKLLNLHQGKFHQDELLDMPVLVVRKRKQLQRKKLLHRRNLLLLNLY